MMLLPRMLMVTSSSCWLFVSARVRTARTFAWNPTLIPRQHPLAGVHGAFNAVFVEAENAGELMFYGPGAGGAPTASAVLGDFVSLARRLVLGWSRCWRLLTRSCTQPLDNVVLATRWVFWWRTVWAFWRILPVSLTEHGIPAGFAAPVRPEGGCGSDSYGDSLREGRWICAVRLL